MFFFRKKLSSNKVPVRHLMKHRPKRTVLIRFALLLCVLAAYTFFLAWKFGWKDGGFLSVLTWSFFVLCTPIADAGFLLDFPVRLLFGVRMKFSEMMVWAIAITTNVTALAVKPQIYDTLLLTRLFKKILTHPYPYWSIIFLSAAGTFLSVTFGDELLDLVHHKNRVMHQKHGFKLQLIVMAFVFLFSFLAYGFLLEHLGVQIPK